EATVGEAGRWGPDGLADGEIDVMRRQPHVASGHPDLQEPRVRVDQRRAPEPPDNRGRKQVREIDEQVGLRGRLEVEDPRSQVLWRRRAVRRTEREGLGQAVSIQTFPQGRDVGLRRLQGPSRIEYLEPDHLAAQGSQPKGPLEIDPEMAAAIRVRHRVGRRKTDGQAAETLVRVTMGRALAHLPRRGQPSRSRACTSSASYNFKFGMNQFAQSGKK